MDKMIFKNNVAIGFGGSVDVNKLVLKNNKATSEGSGGVSLRFALHGIPFTDDMVIAVRRTDNPKTETRRVKPPRYKVGDVLYVKEGLQRGGLQMPVDGLARRECIVRYCSDGEPVLANQEILLWKWKRTLLPAMFMPRKAARTFIRVLEIREECLHDITDEGAAAEGIRCNVDKTRERFRVLWDSINIKPGCRWRDNPPVWVIRFKRVEEYGR